MTPVEIIAVVAALVTPIKLVTLLSSQRLWFTAVTSRYWKGSGNATMVLSALVAAVTLAFLLQELTIAQIWAAVFFGLALVSMALAPFAKYMLEVERRWFTEEDTVRKGWLAAIVWIGLSGWVLVAVALRLTGG